MSTLESSRAPCWFPKNLNPYPNAVGLLSAAATSEGLLIAFGQFVGYALGTGTVIPAVTLGAAPFRRAIARWILHPSCTSFSELFNTNFIERSHISPIPMVQ